MARSDGTNSHGVKVIVHDASVLIDLVTADLLEPWFTVGFETVVPSLVWREINRKSQKEKLQPRMTHYFTRLKLAIALF